jgi:hypothetical protein
VQAYAALGCHITRNIYSEVGYRYLYDDFRDEGANDFLYQLSLHDIQISAGACLLIALYPERDQKRWIQKWYHSYGVIDLEPLNCDPCRYAETPIGEFMVVAAISQGDLDFSDDRRVKRHG